MMQLVKNYIMQRLYPAQVQKKSSAEAYDIWSDSYDEQPRNMMQYLDDLLLESILNNTTFTDKKVADIGCGTGRHWDAILQQRPLSLTGFDVSAGMLNRLQEKFPDAHTHHISDNLYKNVSSKRYDMILSTLTIGHISDIETALQAWCRILKNDGEIIITDMHPRILAFGGKRNFTYPKTHISAPDFVHPISTIREVLFDHKFRVVSQLEISIDESVKHFYAAQNALDVYETYKGFPIIYGLHLKRKNDTE